MKTDVDSALIELADWFVKNKRDITEPEFTPILLKHCGSEAEVEKFVKFLETEAGQVRFALQLRERKEGPPKPSYLKEKYVRIKSTGSLLSWDSWVKELQGYQKRGETPPEVEYPPLQCKYCGYPVPKEYLKGIQPEIWGGYHIKAHREAVKELAKKRLPWSAGLVPIVAIPKAEAGKSLLVEDQCELVSPANYDLIKWVGIPAPDYSLQFEPEARERKIDEVLTKLRAGVDSLQTSDQFRQFLLTMSKFHDYSIGNQILIMIQKRDATRVAGFSKWKELSRYVKGGERGIAILAPCLPPKQVRVGEELYRCKKCRRVFPASKQVEVWTDGLSRRCPYCQGETEVAEEAGLQPLYFKVVYVFDISQTEGKPLPEFEVPVLTGVANEELFSKLMALTKTQGLEVSFAPKPDQPPEIKGMYSGKSIWVRPEEARAQQLKTLLHEDAHYLAEGVFRIPRADAEVIAESAAFTVGAHFGFDTGTRSFPYIVLWSKDKKVLEANLGAIRKVSDRMITGLEG